MLRLLAFSLLVAANLIALEMGWRTQIDSEVDALIKSHRNDAEKPVAVFDWDNTIAKNDISEAIFHRMLDKDMLFAPLKDDLKIINRFFTKDAISAVRNVCKKVTRNQKNGYLLAGTFYQTSGSDGAKCRAEFAHFYYNEKTVSGEDAFEQGKEAYNRRTIKPSYLWIINHYAGLSKEDIYQLTNSVLDERMTAEAKLRRTENTNDGEIPSYLEIYQPIVALMDKLLKNGFEVWVVSASQQNVVETFAARLNQKLGGRFFKQNVTNHLESDPSRKNLPVIGVQTLSAQGEEAKQKLVRLGITYDGHGAVVLNRVRGCGGHGENEIITYIEGKPCFINMGIKKRPVLALGDADTDVGMLQQASELSIAINRNHHELMCNAYQKNDLGKKKWLVQPMFIDPCTKRKEAYDCRAFTNERGEKLVLAEDSIFESAGTGKLGLDCHL